MNFANQLSYFSNESLPWVLIAHRISLSICSRRPLISMFFAGGWQLINVMVTNRGSNSASMFLLSFLLRVEHTISDALSIFSRREIIGIIWYARREFTSGASTIFHGDILLLHCMMTRAPRTFFSKYEGASCYLEAGIAGLYPDASIQSNAVVNTIMWTILDHASPWYISSQNLVIN